MFAPRYQAKLQKTLPLGTCFFWVAQDSFCFVSTTQLASASRISRASIGSICAIHSVSTRSCIGWLKFDKAPKFLSSKMLSLFAKIGLAVSELQVALASNSSSKWLFAIRTMATRVGITEAEIDTYTEDLLMWRDAFSTQPTVASKRGAILFAADSTAFARTAGSVATTDVPTPTPPAPASSSFTRRVRRRCRGPLRAVVGAPSLGTMSLRDSELKLQLLWLGRLLALHSRTLQYFVLPPLPVLDVPHGELYALGSGAWRTLRGHVRRFEAFETWSGGRPFPVTLERLLIYLSFLARFCLPSVVGTNFSAANFVLKRFRLVPLAPDPAVEALRLSVLQRVGDEVRLAKEAPPFSFDMIRALEELVVNEGCVVLERVLAWQFVILIMASARFDDGLHMSPHTLRLRPEGLTCRPWQTKTDRAGKGTLLTVPRVSFSGQDWLQAGYDLWHKHTPSYYREADFFLFETNGKEASFRRPVSYAAFVDNLRFVTSLAIRTSATITTKQDSSLECTIPSAMSHKGVSRDTIMVQGRWRDERMVRKYTRDRERLALESLQSLVKDVRDAWREEDVQADIDVSDSEHGGGGSEGGDEDDFHVHDQGCDSDVAVEAVASADVEAFEFAKAGGMNVEPGSEAAVSSGRDLVVIYHAAKALLVTQRSRGIILHLQRSGESQLVCNHTPLAMC